MPSEYYNSLGYLAKKRHSEKLTINGKEIQDPYKIPYDSWIDNVTKWPRVEFGDLYTYLIENKTVHKRKFKSI